jgi:putative flippase GtrA
VDNPKILAEAGAVGLRGRGATVVGRVLVALPGPVRARLLRHREMLKFLLVGGGCFLIAVAVNYALKLTVLVDKPVTALTIANITATVVSYVLNREWSFRTRGGRERHHEAALFFGISGVGVVISDVPMWIARYLFDLQTPHVSRLVQEISDFASGIVIGTLIAMVFRLWAFRKWVFPQQDVRPSRSTISRHLHARVPGPAPHPDAQSPVAGRASDDSTKVRFRR